MYRSGNRTSIAPSKFTVPCLIGEGLHTDVVRDNRVAIEKLDVALGCRTATLCCPHCRQAGHFYGSKYRKDSRAHLTDHRVARALGIEQDLIAKQPPLTYSGYAKPAEK